MIYLRLIIREVVIIIKRIISLFSAAIVILSALVATDAIKIDGTDSDNEWEDAEVITYYDNNNGVEAGIIACVIDGFDAYIRLQVFDYEIESENSKAGFVLCIKGEEIFRITATEQVMSYDVDKYFVEAVTEYYDSTGLACEAKIGVKSGIGNSFSGTICFVDNEGVRSNVHTFSFSNQEETEPAKPETTERNTTVKEKTTKEKTTKEKTTKEKTTKEKTTKEKNTKEKTTKAKTTKPKTTKAKTTKIKTTKPKTTHIRTTKKVNVTKIVTENQKVPTAAYAYSPVDFDKSTSAPEAIMIMETQGVDEPTSGISPETEISYYYADESSEVYSKGKKLKTAVCVAAGAGFLLICVWAAVKSKSGAKKAEEKSNEESDKD